MINCVIGRDGEIAYFSGLSLNNQFLPISHELLIVLAYHFGFVVELHGSSSAPLHSICIIPSVQSKRIVHYFYGVSQLAPFGHVWKLCLDEARSSRISPVPDPDG